MLRYIVASVAAIYCLLLLFGDHNRRPEVARQAQDDVTGFSLASFELPDTTVVAKSLDSGISDAEAIRIALEAGKAHRANRKAAPLRGMIAAVEAEPTTGQVTSAVSAAAALRYVTGSRVNLRAGPGTGNAVVGQLFLGDEAEVLDDRDGWYQVRAADGAVSGWIFGKFLGDRQPG